MDGLKKIAIVILAIGMMAAFSAPAMAYGQQTMDKSGMTIAKIAMDNPKLSTLVTAVKSAGLADTLNSPGQYTVFAPSNDAFSKIPSATLTAALDNKDQLKSILTYHVVPGKVTAADLMKMKTVKTLEGQDLQITVKDGKVMVNGAVVTAPDIKASNGVVHVIDTVLMPPAK